MKFLRYPALIALLVLGILVTPLAAKAQPTVKVYRIGYLALNAPPNPFYEAFREGLHDLGYVDGQNILLESRWAEGRPERLPVLAADLVRLKVDLIVTAAVAATAAAKQATATKPIPIVMVNVFRPVEQGLVASLARPGGNITGLSNEAAPELDVKRIEFLKAVVPSAARVAVLWSAAFQGRQLQDMERGAHVFSLALQSVEIKEPSEFEAAFTAMTRKRADAVLVIGDPIIFFHRSRVIHLAAKRRLPSMYPFREFVDAGGLMAYGPSLPDIYRRAAVYVDKILKGAKPADLPVEQPTHFELVINLKTAKALGLTIPQSVLVRADQVIE